MVKKQPGWALPDLKEAQKRSHHQTVIEKALFAIPPHIQMIGQGKKYYLRTYGCQANERDSETLAGILESMQFTPCSEPSEADVILLNTCAIRKNAEDKVLGELGSLKRLKSDKPDLIFAVCGCMAQEEEIVTLLLEKYRHVQLIFGTHNIHRLPELLYEVMSEGKRVVEVLSKEGEVIENLPVRRFGKHKAWVNIMYGCDKFCTYCIVPYTRGKERSRAMEDILDEVRILKEEGYKEVTLLGQNVNSYGKDAGIVGGFASLLEETAKIGIERIRFTTSHPWDFTDEMIDVIARYDNIMPFIHLPVQSGDSEILKIMGRRYTREQYLTLFHKIKERMPNCAISTDIIVGFPNESEEQFENTLSLVDKCQFDNAFTFIYSPREGTPAARMADNVSLEVKQHRLARLNERWNQYAKLKNDAYLGKTVRVLVDGASKKNDQIMSGYTETNKLVNFVAKDAKAGDIVTVKITGCKTFSLDGEQCE
ncbi:(Dimethylallyl)adenosine tRNA methylthiotransferase MiaB [Amedibacillus dolichus CAG:375]|uniref:tRNA-2-methylthio-N(6)-dimethylallyladenosine synthase n=1 Tax=Amedibacillus dolichus CAG:375 TaxID=1263076 RepID=R7G7G4_9FIRM|nr:tRNA (N6-isopentenyl adenosine(37)-C2)-methylthiotransferase MiaB [Amedibacillus dolichus]CDE23349.1 (Dimethylallyl)adenosine tRNA methylthiotransferase MiaB [Amedibacillus dolichus CAG:375]